jgi:hypothetical protein
MTSNSPFSYKGFVDGLRNRRVIAWLLVIFCVALGIGQLLFNWTSVLKHTEPPTINVALPPPPPPPPPTDLACRFILFPELLSNPTSNAFAVVRVTVPLSPIREPPYEGSFAGNDVKRPIAMVLKHFEAGAVMLSAGYGVVPAIRRGPRPLFTLPSELHEWKVLLGTAMFYLATGTINQQHRSEEPFIKTLSDDAGQRLMKQLGIDMPTCSQLQKVVTFVSARPQSASN